MYFLVFQRKACLRLINRFQFLKHVQYFDAHNSDQKQKGKKRKKKIFSLRLFGTRVTLLNILEINECINY